MRDKTKETLSSLMAAHDQKLASAREAAQKRKQQEDEFITRFRDVREQIIRPVMEEFSAELKRRGHECKIADYDETAGSQDAMARIGIEMRVFPAGYDIDSFRSESTPHISFLAAITFGRKVRVQASNMLPGTGGSAGPRGEHELQSINRELVEDEIVSWLREVFTK